jgi:hypothetical protein
MGDYTALANAINTGVVWGAHLDSKSFGRPDYPTWCTLSDNPAWRANADRARDRFGLKHIDSGYLVEIDYPVGLLQDASDERESVLRSLPDQVESGDLLDVAIDIAFRRRR